MDLEIILSEEHQRQTYDIAYMWSLKNDTNELSHKTENWFTDIENKIMVTKWKSRGIN